jgi:hypothetical protein
MGMDLSGAGGYFRWTYSGWREVMELAEEFGWVPSRTGPPRGVRASEWDGTGAYWSNDGQRVYARDAKALAEALERALAAVPEQVPTDEAAYLREFVEYCKEGSFRLY